MKREYYTNHKEGKITPKLSDEIYEFDIKNNYINKIYMTQKKESDSYITPHQLPTITKYHSEYAPTKKEKTNSENISNSKFDISKEANIEELEIKKTEFQTNLPKDIESNENFEDFNMKYEFWDESYYDSSKPSLSSIKSRNKLAQFKEKVLNQPINISDLDQYKEGNLLVPLEKANDENYKILTIKKIKKPSFSNYKSAKKFQEDYYESRKSLDNLLNYSMIRKKKVCFTPQDVFFISLTFYDKNQNEYVFPLVRDDEIGISSYWQKPLIISNADEDVDSDDEQINIANAYVSEEIREAIIFLKKNGVDSISNLSRFNQSH